MNPLDALAATFNKNPSKLNPVGKFGAWAYKHMTNDGRSPIKNVDEVQIVIVPDNQVGKFWTRSGNTIYVPECYPTQLVGSFWEETEAEDARGRKHDLLYYLSRGQEIPWDTINSQTFWGAYSSKLGKAGTLWEVYKGAKSLRADTKSINEWKQEVESALGKFGKRTDSSAKRWLLHASVEMKMGSRTPKVALFPQDKLTVKNELHKYGYLNYNEIFFAGDW